MKKKWIILVCGMLLLATGMILFYPSHEPPTKIIGNIPPRDLSEIKHFVRHEIRQQIFDDFSWKKLQFLPEDIKRNSRIAFKSIELTSNGVAEVIVSLGKGTNAYDYEAYYKLVKGPNGWTKRSATYLNWRPHH